MDLLNIERWRALVNLNKKFSLEQLISLLNQTPEAPVASMANRVSQSQSPSQNPEKSPLNPLPNQSLDLSALKGGIKLDHISQTPPSEGRIVVASGKPLRHMDWFSGKHFILQTPGIRLDAWKANPQVWWLHNSSLPLGTSDLILEEDGRLVAYNIRFHREKLSVADWGIGEFDTGIIADLWDNGVLRASSVQVFFTAADMARVFETDEHVIIPSSELIEWSLVTAPADREAVRLSLDGMGVNNQLATLLLGEMARENSRPIEAQPPASTESNMNELVFSEEDFQELALEIAQALAADESFVTSVAEGVASSEALTSAIKSGVNAALTASSLAATVPAVTPAPAPASDTEERQTLRLRVQRTTPAETPATPAETPAAKPARNSGAELPMNRPTKRTAALAAMVRQK